MKPIYEAPEFNLIKLLTEDILEASTGGNPRNDTKKDDIEVGPGTGGSEPQWELPC